MKIRRISSTCIIDIMTRFGNPKLNKIKEVFNGGSYYPGEDFYKAIREVIEEDPLDKKGLISNFMKDGHFDRKKNGHYQAIITGYLNFLKNNQKKISKVFSPKKRNNNFGTDLEIKVNPEIGFEINGVKTVVKLFFKDDKFKPSFVDLPTFLLKSTYPEMENYGILHMREGRLYKQRKGLDEDELMFLLKEEIQTILNYGARKGA